MAFKRSSFSSLRTTAKKEYFSMSYRLSKKVKFGVGYDVYVIPLGLEQGFYETPCHRIMPHKIDGQLRCINGTPYPTYIKCNGCDEEGNRKDSLCCRLSQLEKSRLSDRDDSQKRIVGFSTSKIHLPVLILGNTVGDDSKISYPISKVSILNDLHSEGGLKFAYLEFSTSTFMNDIILGYGKKLKEDGLMEYDLSEDSDEFVGAIQQKLTRTILKIHGVAKQGFTAALKEYSFFPFETPAIAMNSPQGEREAIIRYKQNNEIMSKVDEFLNLFNAEVDNLIPSYSDKDLQEYYNSAIGLEDIRVSSNPTQSAPQETIEFIPNAMPVQMQQYQAMPQQPMQAMPQQPVQMVQQPVQMQQYQAMPQQPVQNEAMLKQQIDNSLNNEAAVNSMLDNALRQEVAAPSEDLDDFEFDSDGDDFFEE